MSNYTVQILCIGTDRSQQTVQTKIRLLLKKQSDQGLHCLPFHQHLLDALMQSYIKLFYFQDNYGNLFEVSQILEFLQYLSNLPLEEARHLYYFSPIIVIGTLALAAKKPHKKHTHNC